VVNLSGDYATASVQVWNRWEYLVSR